MHSSKRPELLHVIWVEGMKQGVVLSAGGYSKSKAISKSADPFPVNLTPE